MTFQSVAVMALLVEAVVHNLRMVYDKAYRQQANIVHSFVALAVAEALCFLGAIDIFEPAGVPLVNFPSLVPWAGYAFTGIILQRGSGWVFDLITKLRDITNPPQEA